MNQPENKKSVIWKIVFLTPFVALGAITIFYFIGSVTTPLMGVELVKVQGEWRAQIVEKYSVAFQAGIMVGDKPIEINGQPAAAFLEQYNKSGIFVTDISDLVVINGLGQTRSASVKNASSANEIVFSVSSWLAISLFFWAIGFYVFLKKPLLPVARVLCAVSVTFGLALGGTAAAQRGLFLAVPLSVAGTTFGSWMLLRFFMILPEERTRFVNKLFSFAFYAIPGAFFLLFLLIGYTEGQPVLWFRIVRYAGVGFAFLASVIVAIYNYFGAAAARTRQQMKIIMVGTIASLLPFFLFYLLPQIIWNQPVVPETMSVLFFVFFPLSMGYAVVAERLMDIDVIIRRGIVYGLITLLMTAILAAAIFYAIESQRTLGVSGEIGIALILGLVATLLFGPVKKGIEAVVDRLLYKDRYDYRQIIRTVSGALQMLNDKYEIARLVVNTAVKHLNLAGAGLFLKNDYDLLDPGATHGAFSEKKVQNEISVVLVEQGKQVEFPNPANLTDPDTAFIIPLRVEQESEFGFLYVSHKTSRQEFSNDDLFLLQGLGALAAMALHRAKLVDDVNMRDTFVSIASHELRTPLTSIIGYTDLIIRRNPPEESRKQWLRYIYDSAIRLSEMVDDLLNVSRIQSGRVTFKKEKVSLPEVLDEALSLISGTSAKHEFVTEIQLGLPEVFVDKAKFGQIVSNLLSNAVKYSPKGGKVTLGAQWDKPGSRVVVSVKDEGVGISPEDRAQLFTTFHRILTPETQGIRGSGLGLYIAKEWAEAMGGEIWLESELGKGSTFFVTAPVRDDTQQTTELLRPNSRRRT